MKRQSPVGRWNRALSLIGAAVLSSPAASLATAHFGAVGCAAATATAPQAVQQANTPRSVWDGVYTDEQARRGQKTYQQECAQCHLDDLLGDGIAPALIGSAFSFRWSDLTVGDMLVAVRTTMPQGAPASLSRQAYVDIAAYLLKVNEFPAGDEELNTDDASLEQIVIQDKPSDP